MTKGSNLLVAALEHETGGRSFRRFRPEVRKPRFRFVRESLWRSSHRIETIESFIPTLDEALRSGACDPDRLFRERAGSGRRTARARDQEGVVGWQIENNHRQLAVP